MNLEQALNYHNTCIICGSEMEIKSPDLAGVRLDVKEDGLEVKTGHKKIAVLFKYDGTYHKMWKWNALYAKPLTVLKECPACIPVPDPDIKYKRRGHGWHAAQELHFAYQFCLYGDDSGRFIAHLDWEDIKYYNKHTCYHINSKFHGGYTWYISSHQDKSKFNGSNVSSMTLPTISTAGVSNIGQLINKIKLYTVFS